MNATEMTARPCYYDEEIVHRHSDQESHDLHELVCAAQHQIELDEIEREVYLARGAKLLKLHTESRCRVCSRKLRSATSIAAGIGPECAAHVEAALAALNAERTQREQQEAFLAQQQDAEAEEIQLMLTRIQDADLVLSGVTPVPAIYSGSWEDADDWKARTWAERLELVAELAEMGIEVRA